MVLPLREQVDPPRAARSGRPVDNRKKMRLNCFGMREFLDELTTTVISIIPEPGDHDALKI
jgi:hypothetical protein